MVVEGSLHRGPMGKKGGSCAAVFVVGIVALAGLAVPHAQAQAAVGSLPVTAEFTAAVWAGGAGYVFGGDNAGSSLASVTRFDPTTGTATNLPATLPGVGSQAPSAVSDGTNAYVFGGASYAGYVTTGFLNQIVRLNPGAGTLTTLASTLPTGRDGTSAIWDGASNAYIFGGFDNTGRLDKIVRFSPGTGLVTTMPSLLPTVRAETSAVWDGAGNAYILGGFGPGGWINQIVRYTPATGVVSTMAETLPTSLTWTSAFWDGVASAYIVGGQNSAGTSVTSIIRYTPCNHSVTVVASLPNPGRERTSAAWDGVSTGYVFAGKDDATGNLLSSIVAYNIGVPTNPCVVVVPPANRPPVVRFTAKPLMVGVGEPVEFVDGSTDPDAADGVAAWNWDFGDGNTGYQRSPIHIFGAVGSYSVRLAVADTHGLSAGPVSQTITVVAPAGPSGSASGGNPPTPGAVPPVPAGPPPAGPAGGLSSNDGGPPLAVDAGAAKTATAGGVVALRAAVAGPNSAAYRWTQTFGPHVLLAVADSATLTFTAPQVPSTGAALYFEVAARDGTRSGFGGVMVTVQSANVAPVAKLAALGPARIGDQVTLDGSPSTDANGDALSYRWTQWSGPAVSLADATAAKARFTAPSVGTYRFAFEASDGTLSSVAEVSVTVALLAPPASSATMQADFTVTLNGAGLVTLTPTAGAGPYVWEFGDGSPSATTPGPTTHTYESSGSYNITMTGADSGLVAAPTVQREASVGADVPHARDVAPAAGATGQAILWVALGTVLLIVAALGATMAVRRRAVTPPAAAP